MTDKGEERSQVRLGLGVQDWRKTGKRRGWQMKKARGVSRRDSESVKSASNTRSGLTPIPDKLTWGPACNTIITTPSDICQMKRQYRLLQYQH